VAIGVYTYSPNKKHASQSLEKIKSSVTHLQIWHQVDLVGYFKSRHTVVCRAAQENGARANRVSILTGTMHQSYNQTIRWLRCTLSFSLLRSLIMYIRGARSSSGKPQLAAGDLSLIVSEARL